MSNEGTKAGADYGIDIQDALIRRGIENPYQLWQKISGSKETTAILWAGTAKQIHMETMNKLYNILGIAPAEYLVNKANSGRS